jgi:hypothetical protein
MILAPVGIIMNLHKDTSKMIQGYNTTWQEETEGATFGFSYVELEGIFSTDVANVIIIHGHAEAELKTIFYSEVKVRMIEQLSMSCNGEHMMLSFREQKTVVLVQNYLNQIIVRVIILLGEYRLNFDGPRRKKVLEN